MNSIHKVLFWMLTIGLGFVNPLISVALVVLYYLPGIIQSAVAPAEEIIYDEHAEYDEPNESMKEYSDDIREKMR
ncbi:MAG: hypothetical protein ACW9XA_06440 [Candidatus Nitrosopumilus sp. bin_6a]